MLGALGIGLLSAQTVAQKIDGAPDGRITLTFKARPGVCFHGNGTTISYRSQSDDWEEDCGDRLALLVLTKRNGNIVDIAVRGSGRWKRRLPPVSNLGRAHPRELAELMLSLADTTHDSDAGRRAVMVAASTDSVDVSDRLIRLALDTNRPERLRRGAIFWAGQYEMPSAALIRIYDLLETRKLKRSVIFSLSQRDDNASVDKLVEIARNDPNRDLRKAAWFWLGQSTNPRALEAIVQTLSGSQ